MSFKQNILLIWVSFNILMIIGSCLKATYIDPTDTTV